MLNINGRQMGSFKGLTSVFLGENDRHGMAGMAENKSLKNLGN